MMHLTNLFHYNISTFICLEELSILYYGGFFVVGKSEVFSFLFTSFDIPCQIDNGSLEPIHYCSWSQKFQQQKTGIGLPWIAWPKLPEGHDRQLLDESASELVPCWKSQNPSKFISKYFKYFCAYTMSGSLSSSQTFFGLNRATKRPHATR